MQTLKHNYSHKRPYFSYELQENVVSSDEITFHLGGKAKQQNIPCTGIQNPHYVTDHAGLSPNVNVCYTVYDNEIQTPFLFYIKLKLRGFSPRANHTDRAAAAGRRS